MVRPWMKFYTGDWRSDPALRVCSLAARGLWMEMLCIMHEAAPRGSLLINSQPVSGKQLAMLVGMQIKDVAILLGELAGAGVFSRDADSTIFSRRMRRDTDRSEEGREHISKRYPNRSPSRSPNRSGDKKQPAEPTTQKLEPDTEANASGAEAPRDIRAELFGRGLKILGEITGKPPDSCRSAVGKWLKSVDDEAIHVLAAIEDCERNRSADPVGRIFKLLQQHGRKNGEAPRGFGRQPSAITAAIDGHIERLSDEDCGDSQIREAPPRLLSHR